MIDPIQMAGAMERPGFMKRRAADEGGGGEAKLAKVLGEASKDAEKSGGSVLQALVKVLATLVLVNAAELREISGFLFVTFLVPVSTNLVIEGLKAGIEYNNMVKKKGDKGDKEETKEDEEMEETNTALGGVVSQEEEAEHGPPHLYIALAALEGMNKDDIGESERQVLKSWWETCVQPARSHDELGMEIKAFRVKKPPKQSKSKKGKPSTPYAKVSFAVRDMNAEQALARAMEKIGGVRKVGTPPRGTLEREAQRLLNKMK